VKPVRAVAGLNAFLADIEERAIMQRAPVPADFKRTPVRPPALAQLLDELAASHELDARRYNNA
jgi:hypothetical protein